MLLVDFRGVRPQPKRGKVTHDAPPKSETGLAIDVDNLTFTYPGAEAPSLKRMSFHIDAGETIGIFGPTGSGKRHF